jgi:hypothetical protein
VYGVHIKSNDFNSTGYTIERPYGRLRAEGTPTFTGWCRGYASPNFQISPTPTSDNIPISPRFKAVIVSPLKHARIVAALDVFTMGNGSQRMFWGFTSEALEFYSDVRPHVSWVDLLLSD